MLLLTSTSDLVKIVTGQAIAVSVHASWVDNASGTITPGRTNTAISTATTTTVVGSPAASTQRTVKLLNVANTDASNPVTVTVQHTDGTTNVTLCSVSLAAGYVLQIRDDGTYQVISSGGVLLSAGGLVSRGGLSADAKNWSFIGKVIVGTPAIRTPLLSWTTAFEELWFQYFIAGYSGGAIARLIVGPASGLSETGTTFCTGIMEGATLNSTSVSVPGWPSGQTAITTQRFGNKFVQNVPSLVKTMTGFGASNGTAPTTAPLVNTFAGLFNDSTNSIQQAELAVYAALTGAAISATTLNAGSYLMAWGRNGD